MHLVIDVDAIKLLGSPVRDGRWPMPTCAHCLKGQVVVENPHKVQNAESKRANEERPDEWEPEWIFGLFTATGRCLNQGCTEPVILTGRYRIDLTGDRDEYDDYFELEYATPPLAIMTFASGTHAEVQEGVTRAAGLLFADPPSAANALRATVERFLTVAEIPSTEPKKNSSESTFLTAHARIERWKGQTDNEQVADLLLAVKWIGNDGSHEVSNLTVAQVLDGVAFLERAFRLLYDSSGDDIDAAARAINANRGHEKPTSNLLKKRQSP